MPARPARACTHPGCMTLVRDKSGRCEKHPPQQWSKKPDRAGNTTQRGYGWSWQQLRERILSRDNYLCQIALREGRIEAATEVDHIVSKADGGTDSETNLQAVSASRHRLKTIQEAQRARRS